MTDRTFLSWKIQDAMMRMQSTPDPDKKLLWARVMNSARRERGDFDQITEKKPEQPEQRHD